MQTKAKDGDKIRSVTKIEKDSLDKLLTQQEQVAQNKLNQQRQANMQVQNYNVSNFTNNQGMKKS